MFENGLSTTISIIVDGKERVYSTEELLQIDQTDLSEEFATQAARYGYFAVLVAAVEADYKQAKHATELMYADTDNLVRQEMKEAGLKTTEAAIKSAILLDEDYCQVLDRELAALRDYKLLSALVRALEQRASMLQSLGAHVRHEYDMTDMTIKDSVDKLSKATKDKIRRNRGQV